MSTLIQSTPHICACGCGTHFLGHPATKYLNDTHKARDARARRRARQKGTMSGGNVIVPADDRYLGTEHNVTLERLQQLGRILADMPQKAWHLTGTVPVIDMTHIFGDVYVVQDFVDKSWAIANTAEKPKYVPATRSAVLDILNLMKPSTLPERSEQPATADAEFPIEENDGLPL